MVFSSVRSYLDPPNWIQQPTFQHELGAGGGASGNLPSTAEARAEENPARSGWAAERARQAKVSPPQGSLKCPRCESTNTKFCYFNNYSLSQPRHFCKTCRRYWTRGGTLRNVPVGGGCRRNKRSKNGGGTSKSAAVDRLAGSSTSRVASPCGASPPLYGAHPTQLPFMDYLAAANVRFSLPYSQLPGTVNRQFSSGVEEWGIEQVQELSHLAAPPTSSLELLHFQEECTASQLSLLKMEENSQPSTFPEQNLGIIGGDFLGGNFNGGGWAELSGFNASTICNLL